MQILAIIPARYASTRLPAKALINLDGKTMIQRVYERAKQSKSLAKIIIATDDERIFKIVQSFGAEVVMTDTSHQSGTDRCAEVVGQIGEGFDFVINIQGDEPFLFSEQIDELISILNPEIEIATLVRKIDSWQELQDVSSPKVVLNTKQEAMYFSRNAIPFVRDLAQTEWHSKHDFYAHIGMYAFRTDVLQKIALLPVSALEKAEKLEQLRWLENGFKIQTIESKYESFSIDTEADLIKAKRIVIVG
jgi:3-deoxy-manno-octulosonate cytidylyltransferase (CMP-KDO synthetase)